MRANRCGGVRDFGRLDKALELLPQRLKAGPF